MYVPIDSEQLIILVLQSITLLLHAGSMQTVPSRTTAKSGVCVLLRGCI